MSAKEGKDIPIFEFAEVVPAGVVTIMELDEAGYTVVRP
jgi:intracellular sulfur oxidation DsrE/DsrF family protein